MNILSKISTETGISESQVRHVADCILRELHLMASHPEQGPTYAAQAAYWNFGAKSAFHLGGIIQEAENPYLKPGEGSDTPEAMQRILEGTDGLEKMIEEWKSIAPKR